MSSANEDRALRIGLHGASGRMGRAVSRLVAADPGLCLAVAWVSPGSGQLGKLVEPAHDFAEPLSYRAYDGLLDAVDVVVEFSAPAPALALMADAALAGVPVVSGTTGFDAAGLLALHAAAARIPLMHAPNMSIGVNVCLGLLERAARALGPDFDVEILEMHHRMKVDAPSGTALRMGEVVAQALERDWPECAVLERSGAAGPRSRREIGFATLRGGDVVGEHTVIFAGAGERIELSHKASSRDTFAQGALRAARWLVDKPAGRYDMRDVLGL